MFLYVLQTLSDPNKDLTPAEIRLGKGQKTKKLTKTENRHEKILLGDLYADKEFLRYIGQKLLDTNVGFPCQNFPQIIRSLRY